ncbi:uncharacterized protein LOC101862959 isoform X2 [Aplysia californica]|uniref:Uncharacterized protein LOC101862959 isoform X2 n=1 Tax=Aplysia californica TaxID=6500 RepID=A0ABM0JV18_APLCA|nr:uncharacterized protein LOC101862959 isoform X2 [Aplysia californica]
MSSDNRFFRAFQGKWKTFRLLSKKDSKVSRYSTTGRTTCDETVEIQTSRSDTSTPVVQLDAGSCEEVDPVPSGHLGGQHLIQSICENPVLTVASDGEWARLRGYVRNSEHGGSSVDPDKTEENLYAFAREAGGPYETELWNGNEADLNKHKINCRKNPGHKKFIPAPLFGLKHLPQSHQEQKFLDMIKLIAKFTVRVRVKGTSSDRPEGYPFAKLGGTKMSRVASGYVYDSSPAHSVQEQICKIKNCPHGQPGSHKVYGHVNVITARHVIYDLEEAKNSEMDLFYDDDEDKSSIVTLRCIDLHYSSLKKDCAIVSCVAHDKEVFKVLEDNRKQIDSLWAVMRSPKWIEDIFVIVSHPHGTSKQISIGTGHRTFLEKALRLFWTYRVNGLHCGVQEGKSEPRVVYSYTAATCPGSSGAPVWFLRHCLFADTYFVLPYAAAHSRHIKGEVNQSGREYGL